MYYQTPSVDKYVTKVIKYRMSILLFFLFTFSVIVFAYKPQFILSDDIYWLKESQQSEKGQTQTTDALMLSKIQVHVEELSPLVQKKLQDLHEKLEKSEKIDRVLSLFSHKIVQKDKTNNESSMLGVISIGSLESYEMKHFINELSNPNEKFVEDDFHTFNFFLYSKDKIEFSKIDILFPHVIETIEENMILENYLSYFIVLLFIFVIVFRVLFSNLLSSVSAIIAILLTTTFTFSIIYFLLGKEDIYIAFPFISMSIALVDYLFFYYRWHVSQYTANNQKALIKMLNRNLSPAFWTLFVATSALGSLLFIDSNIIRTLSLSVILTSIIGYVVNLTFLPALLSFFHLKHAYIPFNKICSLLAITGMNYNKKYLLSFLITTFLLIVIGANQIYDKSSHFFDIKISDDPLVINIPYKKIDVDLIHSIEMFSKDLEEAFPDNIEEIVKSLTTMVYEFNEGNSQTTTLNTQALEQTLFYMDLYGVSEEYYNKNYIKVTILPDELNKQELINWLINYKKLDINFIDRGTLINNAMHEKTLLLSVSLFSALVVLGLFTGWIFRSYPMVFVGFIVNTIPIVWFGLAIKVLNIPLSIELLVAMTIVVGLASDASVHFFFKYFRSRYFGRTKKHSLEKMFFYSGIPVIFGSLILIVIFLLLTLSPVEALQDIGIYSASLITLTLISDVVILPIILLSFTFADININKIPNNVAKK